MKYTPRTIKEAHTKHAITIPAMAPADNELPKKTTKNMLTMQNCQVTQYLHKIILSLYTKQSAVMDMNGARHNIFYN